MLSSPWMALAGAVKWGMQWLATPSTATASAFALAMSILFYRARKYYRTIPLLPAFAPGITPPDCMGAVRPAPFIACEHMFLPRSEPRTTGLRALAGLALDFALLRDERSDTLKHADAVHPHRRVIRRPRRHRGGEVAARPQVCLCARTSDHNAS